jgi:hypothetical protein
MFRELRGVWPGISLSYDRRTTRAAAHLGLLDPDADDASNKFTRGLQNSLKPIAHATGIVITSPGLGNYLYLCG